MKNAIIALAVTLCLLEIPSAYAATERVTVQLYFNIGAVDELTVTLLGESAVTSATGAGTPTPANIEFNTTSGTELYVNATVTNGGSTQDTTNPILKLESTGTTTLLINMSLDSSLDACLNATYDTAHTYTPSKSLNESINVTLNTSLAPGEGEINLWLWANFDGCLDGDDDNAQLIIYAETV